MHKATYDVYIPATDNLNKNEPTTIFPFLSIVATCLFVGLISGTARADVPIFSDVTTSSGAVVVLMEDKRNDTGGGAAWIDFDNDDDPDLFVPGQRGGDANYLYENDGNGSFTNVASQAGVEMIDRACTGAAVGDIDNDGFDDLFVTCGVWLPDNLSTYPEPEINALFLNLGNDAFGDHLGFQDITVSAGLVEAGNANPSYAASFGDIDGDNDLDLYVGNYSTEFWDPDTYRQGSPWECPDNNMYVNNGDNTFTDMAAAWGVLGGTNGCALGVILTDYDHDGDLDIFVANQGGGGDPTSNWGVGIKDGIDGYQLLPPPANHILHRNDGNGQFTEVAGNIGVGDGSNAMGVAVVDYDNDDDLDFYVTDGGNDFLYTNNGDNNGVTFTDMADAASATTNNSVAWGVSFFDPDNDGLSDIYVAHGRLMGPSNKPNQLYMNQGDGTFSESATDANADNTFVGRGVAIADYDRDGLEDIFATNNNGVVSVLYHNEGATGNTNKWLDIRLQGVTSNKRGIGAKVRVSSGQGANSMTQLKEVHGGSGHASTNDLTRVHFGLGSSTFATLVTVEWPSGCVQVEKRVPAGTVDIIEDCP